MEDDDELELELLGLGPDVPDLLTPVRYVMSKPVVHVPADASLRSLARSMAEDCVGAVVLRAADGTDAIVTERDVVEALADGADPDDVWAAEVAAVNLVAVGADQALVEVARTMVDENIRHVPVTANGVLVGMVSARDVLRAVSECRADRE